MSEQYLNRADAPFGDDFWELVDRTVLSVAAGQLSARKLLHAEGPYGLGSTIVPGTEERITSESDEVTELSVNRPTPLTMISTTFLLSARNIATSQRTGISMDLRPLVEAVLALAAREDALLYYGSSAVGVSGLTNAAGIQSVQLKPWNEPGEAVASIIEAVRRLDGAGFAGPYSVALAPDLYNLLFRKYPQSDTLEIDHLKALITDGVIKALNLKAGGLVVASGQQFASIVLGQDLSTGFEGPTGRDYTFTLSETLALRLTVPSSVCYLQP